MLVLSQYKFKNGFDGKAVVVVIRNLNITTNSNMTLTHELQEETHYVEGGYVNTSLNISADIYKDKAAYDGGAVPVEALQFKVDHGPADELSDHYVDELSVPINEQVNNDQAFELAYQAIKSNRPDLFGNLT